MRYHGQFTSQKGEIISVEIVTRGDTTQNVEIGGSADSPVHFADDPVEIQSEVNDTFDHLLRSSASIRLHTRGFLSDMFCPSCFDSVVRIYKGGDCVFAGFIEPQAYSQSYIDSYDDFELSCIDVLSALQYAKYRNIGTISDTAYSAIKSTAGYRTFQELISECILGIASKTASANTPIHVYYDGSKAMTAEEADRYTLMDRLSVSELLFLDDDSEDVKDQSVVIEEILRYLNLHIVQEGLNFYIFSWESVKNPDAINWRDIFTGDTLTTPSSLTDIVLGISESADTSLSIGEVYNRISVECDVESIDTIMENPLDGSNTTSPFTNKQLYLREYSTHGVSIDGSGPNSGDKALEYFNMLRDGTIIPGEYNGIKVSSVDWYIQMRSCKGWTFPEYDTKEDVIAKYCRSNRNQHLVPNLFGTKPQAAIISMGHRGTWDDSANKTEMTTYLVVNCQGGCRPVVDRNYGGLEISQVTNDPPHRPYAIYTGSLSGATLTPPDDGSVNYIVISGDVFLSPLMAQSISNKGLIETGSTEAVHKVRYPVLLEQGQAASEIEGPHHYNHYYGQIFFAGDPEPKSVGEFPFVDFGLNPPTVMFFPPDFRYEPANGGIEGNRIYVLHCTLSIGDKYWNGEKWSDIYCTFPLAMSIEKDDYIIGEWHELVNTVGRESGIDAKGMAIPIRRKDKVGGRVCFSIVDVAQVCLYCNIGNYGRSLEPQHIKAWRTARLEGLECKRGYNCNFGVEMSGNHIWHLMEHVSQIWFKSLEIKVYSDNGLVNNTTDNDIVYVSDTDESYINAKSPVTFRIVSELTRAERLLLGVTDSVKYSTPIDTLTGYGIKEIYDHSLRQSAKPEQLYVDSYYRECHLPRVELETDLTDNTATIHRFGRYHHPALGENFFVIGISRNLIGGYAKLNIKEID